MLWLYLNFSSLQLDFLQTSLSVCAQSNEAIAGCRTFNETEVAVVIVDSKQNAIVQANNVACAQGIKLGMGLGLASSLIHDLSVHPYQKEKEQQYLYFIADQLYQIAADIALFPPHGLAVKVSNMLRLYGDLTTYITLTKQILSPLNVTVTFACAPSVFSAQLLACAGVEQESDDADIIENQLASIDINQLDISDSAKEDILRLGIHTLVQLYSLPLHERVKRFDSKTLDYLKKLQHGNIDKSLNFYQPQEYFEHDIELLYEIKSIARLLLPLERLLKQLEHFLARRNISCLAIVIQLFHHAEDPEQRLQHTITIASASSEYKMLSWLKLAKIKLSCLQLTAPITNIKLIVRKFSANQGEMDDLFIGKKGQLPFKQLVSLLISKLGESKVLRLHALNDHRIEKGSDYIPYIAHQFDDITKRELSAYPNTASCIPLRPSFILATPEPLLCNVHLLSGPERIETAWWEFQSLQPLTTKISNLAHQYQRDYFVARNTQGQCCWVYKDNQANWYVHGYFS